jgi:seryl-tRNA synthetase
MREFVRIGSGDEVVVFRQEWMEQAQRIAAALGLPYRIAPASDPFFGRTGQVMAISQLQQALKFELLIPVRSAEQPTACMRNYHLDHFGLVWGLRDGAGAVAHSGCVAFGMDRLALALFAQHGVELRQWPRSVLDFLEGVS